MEIRSMTAADWPEVRRIYLEGIATGIATFQQSAPEYEEWDRGHLRDCRLVAVEGERVLGWTALSATSSRPVYRGVVEVSLYVGADSRGQGVGKALLTRLIEDSEAAGYWTLMSSVFEENAASRALHRSCGFREVGCREKIAVGADGNWHNTILIERRSPKIR